MTTLYEVLNEPVIMTFSEYLFSRKQHFYAIRGIALNLSLVYLTHFVFYPQYYAF